MYAFAQASFIDRASNSYHLWIDVLARVHFIGRVSRGDPYLIGEKVGEIKFLVSDRAKCELQSRFVGLVINASTEAFCFLVLKGKFRLQPGWINYNHSFYLPQDQLPRFWQDVDDIGGKPLLKKSMREQSSVSGGLTDQWTDVLLEYNQQLFGDIAQDNRSLQAMNRSGLVSKAPPSHFPNTHFSFPEIPEEQMKKYDGDELRQDDLAGSSINLRHCGNRQIMNDDEDIEWE